MPTYCGYCDSAFVLRPLDDRPVFRATHTIYYFCCNKKIQTCESCAHPSILRSCPQCRVGDSRLQKRERTPFDPDDDTDDEEAVDANRNCADVRIDPPRFTPLARTSKMLPLLWELKDKWYETKSKSCTGCSEPGRLFRWLFDVVMVHDGKTQRYRHKLCFRCVACVTNRIMSIQAATMSSRTTCLDIQPTRTKSRPSGAFSEDVYVSASGLKFYAGWEHARRMPCAAWDPANAPAALPTLPASMSSSAVLPPTT